MMTNLPETLAQLSRMEEARRQVQRQLELIDRQIARRAAALVPQQRRRHGDRRGTSSDMCMVLERYRSTLAALTAERQPEIDALSRKLSRQDQAIAAHHARQQIALSPAA
jgi:multidrug efflux pump subunit AcrA (membrane-fusion protein)